MKVKQLIAELEKLDGDCDIRVSLRKGWRPAYLSQDIHEIIEVIDQDTNKLFYCIDIDLEERKLE